jgi:squalene cyclase
MPGDLPDRAILGFTRSHWMPPSVECSHRIAVAAAMVNDFDPKHKTLTKTIFR